MNSEELEGVNYLHLRAESKQWRGGNLLPPEIDHHPLRHEDVLQVFFGTPHLQLLDVTLAALITLANQGHHGCIICKFDGMAVFEFRYAIISH